MRLFCLTVKYLLFPEECTVDGRGFEITVFVSGCYRKRSEATYRPVMRVLFDF